MESDELIENAGTASGILKAMSNERRLTILCHLVEAEKSVGELEGLLDLSQSALSQHLARLRRAGIVKTRRSAQTIYYSLNGGAASAIIRVLDNLFRVEPEEFAGSTQQAVNG
ncbi:MAG: metalloregulator ArsR/SmtB family transcription factor [Alphaproteobacteria bacterium]|jgi:DNA-binding transcriptional ArsR family regulator|nr:metalloregulator ArsR/SmtB family transcription factor [Alphaproteobacteria bacterium]